MTTDNETTESPNPVIHTAQLAGYSSVVGQPIMLLAKDGRCIGQLSLIGAQGDYKAMVSEVADALQAPNRHAYKVGVAVGKSERADKVHALVNCLAGFLVYAEGTPITRQEADDMVTKSRAALASFIDGESA